MSDNYRIGIVGAGSMGGAVAVGLVASGAYDASRVSACDFDTAKLEKLESDHGVAVYTDAREMIAAGTDVLVLAVKPQVMRKAVEDFADLTADKLVISIAAGVPLASLEEWMPSARVVRVMPNLPIQVRSGATAIAGGARATDEDVARVQEIFGSFGSAVVMREDQVDVCACSVGCAPALFALMVDSLTRAAVRRGMAADAAREMFEATMEGTARMLLESGEHPRTYMERVTSPGGTTIEYLRELEPELVRGCENGIDAALKRNDELAGK